MKAKTKDVAKLLIETCPTELVSDIVTCLLPTQDGTNSRGEPLTETLSAIGTELFDELEKRHPEAFALAKFDRN